MRFGIFFHVLVLAAVTTGMAAPIPTFNDGSALPYDPEKVQGYNLFSKESLATVKGPNGN